MLAAFGALSLALAGIAIGLVIGGTAGFVLIVLGTIAALGIALAAMAIKP